MKLLYKHHEHAGGPDFVVSADYFRNTTYPSGITGYLLSYKVVGAGAVELDPQPDENGRYVCNQEVTLQATPEDKFIEWSGDLTGSDTIVTLTVVGDKSVTAIFAKSTVFMPSVMSP